MKYIIPAPGDRRLAWSLNNEAGWGRGRAVTPRCNSMIQNEAITRPSAHYSHYTPQSPSFYKPVATGVNRSSPRATCRECQWSRMVYEGQTYGFHEYLHLFLQFLSCNYEWKSGWNLVKDNNERRDIMGTFNIGPFSYSIGKDRPCHKNTKSFKIKIVLKNWKYVYLLSEISILSKHPTQVLDNVGFSILWKQASF